MRTDGLPGITARCLAPRCLFAAVTVLGFGCTAELDGDEVLESTREPIIFDTDNRSDPFTLGSEPQYHTESTVALLGSGSIVDQGNGTSTLQTTPFSSSQQQCTINNVIAGTFTMCASERFISQPLVAFCSGTLVAPDIIATAGHCVGDPTQVRFVFHWRMNSANSPRTSIANADIYTGSEIVARSSASADWVLVKLDRIVPNHRVAPLRLAGKVGDTQGLFAVGHPVGLPYKYVDGGRVQRNNDSTVGFSYDLDLYPANSGTGIMNSTSRQMEAVHTNGSIWDFSCVMESGNMCSKSTVVCGGANSPCSSVFGNRATEFSNLVPGSSATFFADVTGPSGGKRADLIMPKWDGISIRKSTGSILGNSSKWTTSAVFDARGNFFADVTGDGKADAITVGLSSVTVRRANSGGTAFQSAEIWASSGSIHGSRGTYVADVTSEGRADLIIVNDSGITVRRSTGSSFSPGEAWSGPFFAKYGNYFADVTGDGKADAIVVDDMNVVVRRVNGASTAFSANENWTAGPFIGQRGNYFADVTGDGKADAIVVNTIDGVFVRRSNGAQFQPNETWISGAFLGQAGNFFADVTGDGKADAIAINLEGIFVRRSDGSSFLPNELWSAGDFGTVGVFPSSQH
jgi:hypothetical protein